MGKTHRWDAELDVEDLDDQIDDSEDVDNEDLDDDLRSAGIRPVNFDVPGYMPRDDIW